VRIVSLCFALLYGQIQATTVMDRLGEISVPL
jgi:hypothetical protein